MKKFILVSMFVLLWSLAATAQEVPKYEISVGSSALLESQLRGTRDYPGWYVSFARNINHWFALEAEYSGHFKSESSYNVAVTQNGLQVLKSTYRSSDHLILAGPKFSYRGFDKVTLYGHVLPGLRYNAVNYDTFNGGPVFSPVTLKFRDTSFAVGTGGGVDVNITKTVGLRALQADFIHSDPAFWGDKNNLRLSSGVVFRFGK